MMINNYYKARFLYTLFVSVGTCWNFLWFNSFPLYVGQQRSKQLSTLYKDERCRQLPAFNILEKMYLYNYDVGVVRLRTFNIT